MILLSQRIRQQSSVHGPPPTTCDRVDGQPSCQRAAATLSTGSLMMCLTPPQAAACERPYELAVAVPGMSVPQIGCGAAILKPVASACTTQEHVFAGLCPKFVE
jgi:hypothetical protein